MRGTVVQVIQHSLHSECQVRRWVPRGVSVPAISSGHGTCCEGAAAKAEGGLPAVSALRMDPRVSPAVSTRPIPLSRPLQSFVLKSHSAGLRLLHPFLFRSLALICTLCLPRKTRANSAHFTCDLESEGTLHAICAEKQARIHTHTNADSRPTPQAWLQR